jgi:chromosomal replication initiator protein
VVNGIFTIPLGSPSAVPPEVDGAASGRFGEFIAGPENRLAACALRPYMDRSATHLSPLVLYGPHGAGKSHLARGLAAWWERRYPKARVQCLTGAEFARAHADALSADRLDAWRSSLAALDLLVLEDLGQMVSKRGAQQELLLLLDDLADREALVVVTCRSLPTRLVGLLPPLRSRLTGGTAVPVALPEAATRRALLEKVATVRRLALDRKTIHALADGLTTSVPSLVSALLELELKSRLDGTTVDRTRARQLVAARAAAKMPPLGEIAKRTAKYFGLTLADLKSPARRQPLVAGRGVAMYLARKLTNKSFDEIGSYFGGRDHTTVLHNYRRIEKLLPRDRATRQAIAELRRMLHAS